YPIFGLAMAFSGNILLLMFFDSVPLGIPAGVLLSYLMLLLLGVLIYHLRYYWRPGMEFGKPQKWSLAIGLLMIIGLVYSSDPAYGMNKVIFYFLVNFILVSFPIVLVGDDRRIEQIIGFTFILGLVLGVITTIQALQSPPYLRFQPSENVNPIWLARSLGVSFLAGIYVLTRVKSRLLRVFLLLSLIFMLYPMFRSWSRAPLIGLVLALIVFYLIQPSQPMLRKIKVSIPIALIAFIALFRSSSVLVSRLQTPLAHEASALFRVLAWLKGVEDFIHSPLLGIGTGAFTINVPFGTFKYAHNLFIELAGENGILGLIFIFAFLVGSIRFAHAGIALNYKKGDKKRVYLMTILLTMFYYALWNSLFSGNITANEGIWLASGLLFTLYLSARRQARGEEAVEP
ncbi:O-antigen ligase family protein, partial [candidate division KSB1 bacterium]|nr:O-antigen ligase family protein [candidate division KSB1 bacterium]